MTLIIINKDLQTGHGTLVREFEAGLISEAAGGMAGEGQLHLSPVHRRICGALSGLQAPNCQQHCETSKLSSRGSQGQWL